MWRLAETGFPVPGRSPCAARLSDASRRVLAPRAPCAARAAMLQSLERTALALRACVAGDRRHSVWLARQRRSRADGRRNNQAPLVRPHASRVTAAEYLSAEPPSRPLTQRSEPGTIGPIVLRSWRSRRLRQAPWHPALLSAQSSVDLPTIDARDAPEEGCVETE